MPKTQWYVAVGIPNGTKMMVAPDREAAIKTAFQLLDEGQVITEVGPMVEPPEGNILTAEAIREMHRVA